MSALLLKTNPCSGEVNDLAELPITVSELVQKLRADVEDKHRHVRVIGEISSFKQWRSGHCYFDIKDDHALLPAVMFRPHVARVPFAIADGMLVLFSGRVSIYPANARLQMIVENMEPLGQGALALAFEQLKERLKTEGLFDAQHKKPIKTFNECVGLITSSHGAVLRDMVRILKTRMPKVNIVFSPARVQGAGAKEEIARAIQLLDQSGGCDVIIVGRGGGSLEDLWAFNEELVARAIFSAKTPIISAVGHETDTTISDFVADVRAATPTHAATIAVPVVDDLFFELGSLLSTIKNKHHENLRNAFLLIAKQQQRLKDPRVLLFRHFQKLDDENNRLHGAINRMHRHVKDELQQLRNRLLLCAPMRRLRLRKDALFQHKSQLLRLNPKHRLINARQNLVHFCELLQKNADTFFKNERKHFEQSIIKLEALSPLKVISRGYGLIQNDSDDSILSKVAHFKPQQTIKIRVDDGVVKAVVTTTEKK